MRLSRATKSEADRSTVETVIDLVHLDQYTLGDRALQAQLLQLFRTQLKIQTKNLALCNTENDWKSGTHTLKGAARAVGAGEVCQVAEKMEAIPFADQVGRRTMVKRLEEVRTAFEADVEQYICNR